MVSEKTPPPLHFAVEPAHRRETLTRSGLANAAGAWSNRYDTTLLMWMVKVRILPPQPIFLHDPADGSFLVFSRGQTGFEPALPAAIHRFRVGVAHLLQIVGDESGAEFSATIQHQFRVRVGALL